MTKADQIIRSKRKTVALEITHDAKLIVRAPWRASVREIERILCGKESWIERTRQIVKEKSEKFPPKKFVDGEEFLFLGKSYKLSFIEDDSPVDALRFDDGFILARRNSNSTEELFIRWYRQEALNIISERVRWFANQSGYTFNDVRISNARKRWGSCSRKGRLRFSWRLIMAPMEVIDYVVVHELAHLKDKNHGRTFWERVERILPSYKESTAWLKENQDRLNL